MHGIPPTSTQISVHLPDTLLLKSGMAPNLTPILERRGMSAESREMGLDNPDTITSPGEYASTFNHGLGMLWRIFLYYSSPA